MESQPKRRLAHLHECWKSSPRKRRAPDEESEVLVLTLQLLHTVTFSKTPTLSIKFSHENESVSRLVMLDSLQPHGLQPARLLCDSPSKNTGVGSQSLLQGIFPTQGSNPSFPHYRQSLYHLRHQGSQ